MNKSILMSLLLALMASLAAADCPLDHLKIGCNPDALWGTAVSAAELRRIAIQALTEERDFNRRAGLGASSDRLPEIFTEEVNPSSGTVFDISPDELDKLEYE